ncbi:MAG TPA: hypothetical protein VHY48_05740 [Acidobacteriaceae bacterium]|jgi:hypothetical protein|nr:hypothetical protein [Acidobacteriaceae bacterium]
MGKRFQLTFLLAVLLSAASQLPALQQQTIAAAVPLHVRVTRTAKIRLGAPVEGVLTQPIYVRDRLVLPTGSIVHGNVTGYAPVTDKVRAQTLLNGDLTPLHDPIVDFSSLHLTTADIEIPLDSIALIRNTQIVRFVAVKHRPSLYHQGKVLIEQRIHEARETAFGPNKKDRALRLLYSQLPYHPQRIWVGTQFVADLQKPVYVDLPAQPNLALAINPSLDGITISARLVDTLDSKDARKGDVVSAIVTVPVLDKHQNLILPQGATLAGIVSQAKAARSFGRNGTLRFVISGVAIPGRRQQKVYGTLKAAEGNAGQNITVDSEGNVQANPDKNRFLAPLLLAFTAAQGHDDDDHHPSDGYSNVGGTTVASNGFGLVARVIALTVSNQSVATGFGMYALAKSIYFRFLTRGHEVSFPKDTQIEVQLSARSKESAIS